MENDLNNRVIPEKTKQGRPSKAEVSPPEPAKLLNCVVPPMICPKCGRGMQPRYDRTKPTQNGEIYCNCSLCGLRFAWKVPVVRTISG